MAELDVSNHSLNTSSSKQKFSFPKTQRFRDNNKSLYVLDHSVVIASIKCLASGAVEPPPSGMGIRILDSRSISTSPLLERMNWVRSSRKMRKGVSDSAPADRYSLFEIGNAALRTAQGHQNPRLYTRTRQVRQQPVYAGPEKLDHQSQIARQHLEAPLKSKR